jgi:photosystem II stability/assembly factor-like uncharacterized protein
MQAFRSADSGAHWRQFYGLRDYSVDDVAVHPSDKNRMAASLFEPNVILTSLDAGQTWNRKKTPINPDGLVMDPHNPDTLYVFRNGSGFAKSTDFGSNWTRPGSPSAYVVSMGLHPLRRVLFIGTAGDGKIFKSVNGGSTWTAAHMTPASTGPILFFGFDPSEPNVIYALSRSGIYRSDNGGNNWTLKSAGLPVDVSLYDFLTVDPSKSGVLFTADGGKMFVSYDRAETWSLFDLAGFPDEIFILDLAIHPQRPGVLHAATTQGVFSYSR